jgi:glycosyltransferase involved in cell wall biosynthesis
MKLSLVISAHNEELRIGHCLASIQTALKMHPCDAEVIVVANACTDDTAAIARGYPGVRVVVEPRKGLPRARKSGFDNSTGDLVANLDADILMPPGWIPFIFEAFQSDPTLVALSGPYIYHDLAFWQRGLVRIFYWVGYAIHIVAQTTGMGAMLQGGNFVVRRDALQKAGGFDTSITFYGEDTDIARRMSKVGTVRWTFKLPMLTSGRRLAKEGIFQTGLRYTANFFWVTFFRRPYSDTHVDIRTNVR